MRDLHRFFCRTGYLRRGIFITLVVFLMATVSALAQEALRGWSRPVIVAQTDGEITQTALVADGTGRAHLFFVNQPAAGDRRSVDYTLWDGTGWSEPVDIIVDPRGNDPTFIRVAINPNQIVHMVWASGSTFLHTAAPLREVSSARAWSTPVAITIGFQDGDLIAAPDGALYFAYAGLPDQGVVQVVKSMDGGLQWSEPIQIAAVNRTYAAPNNVRLAIDGSGHLHAVWTEYTLPQGWPPTGSFYARSDDGGETWSHPLQVAGESHGQIGVGTVGDQEIHLVWRSTIGGDGTFHQLSTDGGETWSVPGRADDRGGFSGLPTFAEDSNGQLHYVIGRTFYAMWDDRGLSPYQDLRVGSVSTGISDGEGAMLAITRGNRLHVVFETDHKYLWYTSNLLDLPPLPSIAPTLPPTARTAPALSISTPTALDDATVALQDTDAPPLFEAPQDRSLSTGSLLIMSVVPALLLVAAVVLIQSQKR